jgi:hypothetical protein
MKLQRQDRQGQLLLDTQMEGILVFLERRVGCSETQIQPPERLLPTLSVLSSYLKLIDDRPLRLLLAVAPYAAVNYNSDRLIEELGRLAITNPVAPGTVRIALLQSYQPSYDFEDHLKKLVLVLAAHSDSRPNAILSAERVRYLPGMVQLYGALTLSAYDGG